MDSDRFKTRLEMDDNWGKTNFDWHFNKSIA